MFIKLFKSTFRLPELPNADWEHLRLSLLKRSLLLLLPFLCLYVVLTACLGRSILPSVAGLAFVVMVLLVFQQHPDARRFLTWVLGLATLALLELAVQLWRGGAPAPALTIASVLGTFGLLLDGPALGALLLAGGLAINVAALRTLAPGDAAGMTAIGLQMGVGIGLYISAWGWYRGLTRAQGELSQASRRLLQQRDDRQVLSLALFHELKLCFDRLQAAIHAQSPLHWNAVHEQALAMQAQATQIRSLRNSFQADPDPAPARTDFDRGVMLAILISSLALACAGLLANLHFGKGDGVSAPLTIALMGLGLFSLRQGRPVPAWLAWAVILIGPLIMAGDQRLHWGQGFSPTLGFWCLSILNAGLLRSWWVAVAMGLAGAALLLAALAALPAPSPDDWHRVLGLILAFILVATICLQAVVWQQSVVRLLEDGRRQLAEGLAQRRRLLGTLFHDLANPLTALMGLSEQGRAGLGSSGDAERARRLAARMGEMLQDNQAWLLGDSQDSGAPLVPVALGPVLAAMLDLYQDKLSDKRLILSVDAPSDAVAMAQAGVLRDSVLSNLLSNAIKFSRPGSHLELEASEQDGLACIELRDRGPGLDASLRERLEQGLDLPSQAGTQGERGQGLGLALVREHLLRMGGSLQLLERDGGGLVARLRLRRP